MYNFVVRIVALHNSGKILFSDHIKPANFVKKGFNVGNISKNLRGNFAFIQFLQKTTKNGPNGSNKKIKGASCYN